MSRLGASARLRATLALDARLQARSQIQVIVIVAALLLAGALRALFTAEQLRFFMPLIALSGVSLTTAFVVGVLVLLERSEGTLDVVRVSPLRPGEYLASKLATLVALALVEGALVTVVAFGTGFAAPWLVLGVLLRAGLGAAAGLAVGVRYDSITRLLMPVIGLALAFDLPVLWYLGFVPGALAYPWPSTPSLILAKAAFYPVTPLELGYALVYGTVAVAVAVLAARRAFDRFVVRGEPLQ